MRYESGVPPIAGVGGLGFQAKAGFGEGVEAAPDEAIDGDDGRGHHHGGGEEEIEVAGVGGLRDGRAESGSRVDVAFEMKIYGDDACVPCSTGGCNESRNKVGEDAG